MPNRVVRDGLLASDPFNGLKEDSQIFFVRLLLIVDDFGRYDGRDVAIKSATYPVSDKRLTDVSRMLTDLIAVKMVHRYVVDGKPYISIPKFEQRLRQKRERYPAPPEFVSDSVSYSDSDSDSDSGNHACNSQADVGQMSDNCLTAKNSYKGTQRDMSPNVPTSEGHSASVSASASASASYSSEGDARGKDKERIPPTIEEVSAYCAERKNTVDPNKFFDYYTSNGWRVGKNPMRSWKAAVRTWETNSYQSVGQSGRPFVTSSRERKAAQENKEPDYPLPMLKI